MIYQFSATGRLHQKAGIDNQDAITAIECEKYAVIALADGVSSCTRAREGARAACEVTAKLLYGKPEFFFRSSPTTIIHVVLETVKSKLLSLTADEDPRPLSSTLSFVLLNKETHHALLFQLGDGLVVGNKKGRWINLIQPDENSNGTCVTTTIGASYRCHVVQIDATEWTSFMLLTDGAWRAFVHCGMIKKVIAEAYARAEYTFLENILQNSAAQDDHSFVILNAS